MIDTKLLPCPFCGREPTSTGREGSPGCDKPYVHFVACYCGGHSDRAHQMGAGLTLEEAERTAIAAWNRRAQPAPRVAELSAEVERLRKDAERYRWLRDRMTFSDLSSECGSTAFLDRASVAEVETDREIDDAIDRALAADAARQGANDQVQP